MILYGQGYRLRFIDRMLHHYGWIRRMVVMDYFGLSQPQASVDLQAYIKLAPHNVVYNKTTKQYESTPEFERIFSDLP
jgi:hypothetical protein